VSLRIRTVARLSGVREATLRAWEKRYGFPRPGRSAGNYRLYSPEELQAVREVARLLAEGLSASEAIAQVRRRPRRPQAEGLRERFWTAVQSLAAEQAEAVLEEAQGALASLTLCDEVLLPLLRELPQRLDTAREHLASGLLLQRLRALLTLQAGRGEGPRALLACPAQEAHEGGLLALALHLRVRGWRLLLLGADTPAEALQSACRAARPDLVALSCVRRRGRAEWAALVREAVQACAPTPVVLGGPACGEALEEVLAAGALYAGSAEELVALHARQQPAPS
jgi:DNA-binding transcriptional MerR regulator